MSRRVSPLLQSACQLRSQSNGSSRWSLRNQWQRLPVTQPNAHRLCRHFATPATLSTSQPHLPPPHLPSPPLYRSPVHFIPPTYQPSTASAEPFTFILLYRYPPHYEAEDNPQYANKPFQFLLKLGQPSTQHASGVVVWECVLSGDLSIAELERVLVSNMHWLTSVQVAVKGKVVPQSAAIESLYGKSNISLVLHPHHSSAYDVSINGGLPLSRGVLSYISRNRILYLSAVVLVIALIMQSGEERPTRPHTDGSRGSMEDGPAQEHWRQMVNKSSEKVRDTLFAPSDESEKK